MKLFAYMDASGALNTISVESEEVVNSLILQKFINPASALLLIDDAITSILRTDEYIIFAQCVELDDNSHPTTIVLNLEKAKRMWVDKLIYKRNERLQHLDSIVLRALGSSDLAEIQRLERIRQSLRDLPTTIDVSNVSNISDLMLVYPAVLRAE